jgi:hypothetical protein
MGAGIELFHEFSRVRRAIGHRPDPATLEMDQMNRR